MKNKKLVPLLLAAAIPGAAALGVIPVTDNLGLRGFVDALYSDSDVGGTDTKELKINAVDVDFIFSMEKTGAEVHLSSSGGDVSLEQAFVTYDLGGGLGVAGGKYLSLLGYEGDEPYKLNQQSMAFVIGNDNKIPFAGYHQGVKAFYSSGDLSGAISVVDSVYGSDGTAGDVGFEAQIKYTGLENFIIALGTAQDSQSAATGIDNYYNVWVQYNGIDSLVLGAEYNSYDIAKKNGDSWMVMGNYALNDNTGVTVRFSDVDEGTAYNGDKFTISPNYSFSDNLLGRLEYSTGESGTSDVDSLVLELLFTF